MVPVGDQGSSQRTERELRSQSAPQLIARRDLISGAVRPPILTPDHHRGKYDAVPEEQRCADLVWLKLHKRLLVHATAVEEPSPGSDGPQIGSGIQTINLNFQPCRVGNIIGIEKCQILAIGLFHPKTPHHGDAAILRKAKGANTLVLQTLNGLPARVGGTVIHRDSLEILNWL